MIGPLIKKIRQENGMSQTELAVKTGLTPSFVSQFERGLTEPSLATLRRICEVLGVSMFQFLVGDEEVNPLVKKDQRKRIVFPKSNLVHEQLTRSGGRKLDMSYSVLPAGVVSSDEPLNHACDECIFVLSGRLEIRLGEQLYLVDEGDSIYIDARTPHQMRNIGEDEARIVMCSAPAIF
ncbi:MAG TPA: XRE family transcriptional regulator [Bacillota bacterium]|jgi:transcriptional regulator with XRE-family HTH domain